MFARKIFLIVAALAALTCAPVQAAQDATPADKGEPPITVEASYHCRIVDEQVVCKGEPPSLQGDEFQCSIQAGEVVCQSDTQQSPEAPMAQKQD